MTIEIELYKLTDSFLTEAKDQNGNDRSLERLNQDRHLFVENCLKLIRQTIKTERAEAVKEMLEKIGKELPDKITDERTIYPPEEIDLLIKIDGSKANIYHELNHEKIGFNKCLSEVKKLINKLKAKYE